MGGRRLPPQLCTRCKGYKKLCGLTICPILERFRTQVSITTSMRDLSLLDGATPPNIIVGEQGYPHVSLLYGIPPGIHGDQARKFNDPKEWHRRRISLNKILRLRSSIVSATIRVRVDEPEALYNKELSLAAVSEKPVESEASLERPPSMKLRFDGLLIPQGPNAKAREIRVSSNPSLPRQLEKLIWDYDVKASDAIWELYLTTNDVYIATNALSLGLLGQRKMRRIVPTRWAITAVDDIVAKRLLAKVKRYDTINEVEVYHASYLGNIFTIILAPGSFEAEMVEIWHPLTPWTQTAYEPIIYTIRETPTARITTMDGGYMATRLAIVEHLYRRKRQAKAIIVREITRDYYAPVGNWHIRETSRQALVETPTRFQNLVDALKYTSSLHRFKGLPRLLESLNLTHKILYERSLDEYLKR